MKIKALYEWTWIFSEAVGKAYGQYVKGEDVSVKTLSSTEPFFYFLDDSQLETEEMSGLFSGSHQTNEIYKIDFNPNETWGKDWKAPPFKEHFSKVSLVNSEKPIIVINNKYNPEWDGTPYNFLPLDFLKEFFEKFSETYQIYYIRYTGGKHSGSDKGYYDDVGAYNKESYNDYEIIDDFKNIITIYDYMEENDCGFNESQLMIMSKAEHLISVNGGNAVLSSYFGNDVVIYGHPNCKSTDRGIWKTDSWLKELGGSNIIGHLHWAQMLNDCEERWL